MADKNSNGIMVAFMLPRKMADMVAVPGGLEADDIHMTVLWLGDAKDYDMSTITQMAMVVQGWAARTPPMMAEITGETQFIPPEGQPVPHVLLISALGLNEARAELVTELKRYGIESPTKYGYTPHVTRGYFPERRNFVTPNFSWRLSTVTLKIGTETVEFPLTGVEKHPGPGGSEFHSTGTAQNAHGAGARQKHKSRVQDLKSWVNQSNRGKSIEAKKAFAEQFRALFGQHSLEENAAWSELIREYEAQLRDAEYMHNRYLAGELLNPDSVDGVREMIEGSSPADYARIQGTRGAMVDELLQAGEAEDILGVSPWDAIPEEVRRSMPSQEWNAIYDEWAKSSEANLDKYMHDKMVEIIDNGALTIQIDTEEGLPGLLESGSYLTVFDEGSIGSITGMEGGVTPGRAIKEKWMFGIGDEVPAGLRPIYGFMWDKDDPGGSVIGGAVSLADPRSGLSMYGNASMVLKEAVKARTTYVFGDSVGVGRDAIPQLVTQPSNLAHGFRYFFKPEWSKPTDGMGVARSWGFEDDSAYPYIEIQVHGGITLSDIDTIYLPYQPDSALRKRLRSSGVDWKVVPKPDDERRGPWLDGGDDWSDLTKHADHDQSDHGNWSDNPFAGAFGGEGLDDEDHVPLGEDPGDWEGGGTFSRAETERRLKQAAQDARKALGLPSNYRAEVGFRTKSRFARTANDARLMTGGDLAEFGSLKDASGDSEVRRHGYLASIYFYSPGPNGELTDTITAWLGTEDEEPVIIAGIKKHYGPGPHESGSSQDVHGHGQHQDTLSTERHYTDDELKTVKSVIKNQKMMKREEMVQWMRDQFSEVTDDDRGRFKKWYYDANRVAQELADEHGMSLEQAASVIAISSPNHRWEKNIAAAQNFIKGYMDNEEAFAGMSGKEVANAWNEITDIGLTGYWKTWVPKAVEVMRGGDIGEWTSGVKVRSFYNNIVNPWDSTSVTIDGWMVIGLNKLFNRKGGVESVYPWLRGDGATGSGNKSWRAKGGMYNYYASIITEAARAEGLQPHQMQAIMWSYWREVYG